MAYNYYQQAIPGWGTNQIRFVPPPAPSFQPQSYWGGLDYYRAHAASPDLAQAPHSPPPSSLYNHAVDSARRSGNIGVGLHEAKHWHRRIYGGPSEINMLGPAELGHAAAYEAYRTWIHHSAIQIPLGADIERQREALVGISVAEATRLLQLSGRPQDPYLNSTATEAAAHTASQIFYQSRGGVDDSRSRAAYTSSDPYAVDDEVAYQSYRHPGSGFRPRHASFSSGTPTMIHIPPANNYTTSARSDYADPTPMPYGTTYAGSNAPVTVTNSGASPYATSMTGSASSYSGSSMPVNIPGRTSPYPESMPMTIPSRTSPYPGSISYAGSAQSYSGTSMLGTSPNYAGTSLSMGAPMGQPAVYTAQQPGMYNTTISPAVTSHRRHRSASFSYPQQTYPQQTYAGQPMMTQTNRANYNPMTGVGTGAHMPYIPPQTAPTTIIIKRGHKHKHRRSRSQSRHR